MTTIEIRSAPSGPIVEVLAPPDVAVPDPTKFLNETGTYTVPAGGGAVDSVQGSDGITPTTPQTGVVVLSGAALLPLDGSRAMTGDLDMGTNDVVNAGTYNGAAITSGGSATNYLDETGAYSVPAGQVTSQQNIDYNQCITQNLAGGTCYFALMVAMEDMVLNRGSWDLAVSSAGNFQMGIYDYPGETILVASSPAAYSTSGVITATFTATTAVSKWDKFWLALWVSAAPQAKGFNAGSADGIRSQLAGQPNLPVSFTISPQSFTPWMAVGSA